MVNNNYYYYIRCRYLFIIFTKLFVSENFCLNDYLLNNYEIIFIIIIILLLFFFFCSLHCMNKISKNIERQRD